jgi:hypothetical protein
MQFAAFTKLAFLTVSFLGRFGPAGLRRPQMPPNQEICHGNR